MWFTILFILTIISYGIKLTITTQVTSEPELLDQFQNVNPNKAVHLPPLFAGSLPWDEVMVRHEYENDIENITIDENEEPLLDTSFIGYYTLPIAQFNTTEAKLSIVDTASRALDGRIMIQRFIVNLDRVGVFVSQAKLVIPPSDISNKTIKTTDLPIDYQFLDGYAVTLSSPAFATGTLPLKRNVTGDVLVIGLGGSQSNNFIHNAFPELNLTIIEIQPAIGFIARKYFGFQDDPTQHLLIMDGLDFLQDAVNQGLKYEAVYIDACPSKYPINETILCPGKAFLNKTNIMNVKNVLTDKGTFSMKMLLITDNVTDKALERPTLSPARRIFQVSEPFREVFGKERCVIVPMVSRNNRVLICINEGVEQQKLNIERIWNEMMTFHAPEDWTEKITQRFLKTT